MDTLIQSFMAGGIYMWAILAVGIAVAAISVERFIALYKNYKDAPAELRHRLMSFIALGQFQEAKSFVEMSAPNTAMGRIAVAGLNVRNAGGGDEEVQARMDEALGQEISMIDKRTGFLAVFGNVATLLGLLGTVTGLIASFSGVTNANPAERALLLGKGISEALNTTAFGLAVAIPALVAYALMQNKTERIVSSITDEASKIFHDFLFHTDSRRVNTERNEKMNASSSEENTFQRSN